MGLDVPRTLLVLKPSSFGDIVHTLPAVARLKAAWPDCRISWLTNPEWMPLLEGNGSLAEIVPFPRQEFRGWGGGWRMLRWLRTPAIRRQPDLALDFQGLLRTALVGRACGARLFAGLSDAREGARWFYQQTVDAPPQPVHAVDRYLALAAAMLSLTEDATLNGGGCRVEFPLPLGLPVDLPPDFGDGFVLLHPYARGKDKSLSEKIICELIRRFGKTKTVLVGRCDQPPTVQDKGCLNLLNRTSIAQLIWLTRRASFVISVDSGPAHVAAALGRRMVAIHAWSDPRRVGPYRGDAWVWKNGRLVQVRDLSTMDDSFFVPMPLDLGTEAVEAIVHLATSP